MRQGASAKRGEVRTRRARARRSLRHFGVAAVLGVVLAGCTTLDTAPAADYRYVLLGPEGEAVVRVVTTARSCPTLEVDGRPLTLSVRMPSGTMPPRPTRGGSTAKPAVFAVTTCEPQTAGRCAACRGRRRRIAAAEGAAKAHRAHR